MSRLRALLPGRIDRAVSAALEGVGVGGERQPALALVLAVTLEAVLRQDRPDLDLEINQGPGTICRAGGGTRGLARSRHSDRAECTNSEDSGSESADLHAGLRRLPPDKRVRPMGTEREYISAAHLGCIRPSRAALFVWKGGTCE